METTEKFVRKFCKVKFVGDDTVTDIADFNSFKHGRNNPVCKRMPVKVTLPIENICETIRDFNISPVKTRGQVK